MSGDNVTLFKAWFFFLCELPHTMSSLNCVSRANSKIVQSNVEILVKEGLGTRATSDFVLAKDTCVALLRLGTDKKV